MIYVRQCYLPIFRCIKSIIENLVFFFLETFTNRDIPNESTLRKNYIDDVHSDTLKYIKENI